MNQTNGEVRMRVYGGDGKGKYKWVFAGNAREVYSEGMLRDMASMRLGNFDSVVQASRRNKIKRDKRQMKKMEKTGIIELLKTLRIRIANDGEYRISDKQAKEIAHKIFIEGE